MTTTTISHPTFGFHPDRRTITAACLLPDRREITTIYPKFESRKDIEIWKAAYLEFAAQATHIAPAHHRAVLLLVDLLDMELFGPLD